MLPGGIELQCCGALVQLARLALGSGVAHQVAQQAWQAWQSAPQWPHYPFRAIGRGPFGLWCVAPRSYCPLHQPHTHPALAPARSSHGLAPPTATPCEEVDHENLDRSKSLSLGFHQTSSVPSVPLAPAWPPRRPDCLAPPHTPWAWPCVALGGLTRWADPYPVPTLGAALARIWHPSPVWPPTKPAQDKGGMQAA